MTPSLNASIRPVVIRPPYRLGVLAGAAGLTATFCQPTWLISLYVAKEGKDPLAAVRALAWLVALFGGEPFSRRAMLLLRRDWRGGDRAG
jgi:hypothetical protein